MKIVISQGICFKAKERRVWPFAQASVAVQAVLEGEIVKEIRVVLGGLAPTPWRLNKVEDLLRGQDIKECYDCSGH
jgi:xanthine dehydrogenase YagS FAD-binding subunit